eukprot:CAMPEP_0179943176 /NCGR_PEP_ID=MMETSP0983-20121128/18131_1 /TAXON_ID=483367 /ORGANISM="non described non described, Strain CCMP 2436" /LENGTH=146 /DNA_ID=CAMNT_0021850769 /DNA_START=36 /DNA_END=476 /DNA_ORIENTATION=-
MSWCPFITLPSSLALEVVAFNKDMVFSRWEDALSLGVHVGVQKVLIGEAHVQRNSLAPGDVEPVHNLTRWSPDMLSPSTIRLGGVSDLAASKPRACEPSESSSALKTEAPPAAATVNCHAGGAPPDISRISHVIKGSVTTNRLSPA